ncbi:MAG: hypothetical protein ACJ75B_05655 [Flavisolibacter sp.]
MKPILICFLLLTGLTAESQIRFSVRTDLSLAHNFSPDQQFWAIGQTFQGDFHFSKKETGYIWFNYYRNGKFRNDVTAEAKSPQTTPSTYTYPLQSRWQGTEFSVGWRHYFKGSFDEEITWSLYGLGGLGVSVFRVENNIMTTMDTSLYDLPPPTVGKGQFRRLILDLGVGAEYPASGNIYLYGDIRTWLPASDYPSSYMYSNKNVPLLFSLSGGIKILFGD